MSDIENVCQISQTTSHLFLGINSIIYITIRDENGEEIVVKKGSGEVPFVEEIEAKGFLDAFDDFETAALELTKETRDATTAEYFKEASKKTENRA